MATDRKIDYNQTDLDITRWLPANSGRYKSMDTRNRTVLRMFFEELSNVNNPSEALRNTAKRVEPFGIQPKTLLDITRKWREAHGLKRIQVWGGTRKVSQTKRLVDAINNYHGWVGTDKLDLKGILNFYETDATTGPH